MPEVILYRTTPSTVLPAAAARASCLECTKESLRQAEDIHICTLINDKELLIETVEQNRHFCFSRAPMLVGIVSGKNVTYKDTNSSKRTPQTTKQSSGTHKVLQTPNSVSKQRPQKPNYLLLSSRATGSGGTTPQGV